MAYISIRDIYNNWLRLAKQGFEEGVRISVDASGVSKLVVLGVGGSGVIGGFVESLSSNYEFPVEVSTVMSPWELNLKTLGDHVLVIAVSYSGNTVETLSCLNKVMTLPNVRIVGVTSGGKLEKLSEDKGFPIIKVSRGLLPRAAFPQMLFGILGLLVNSGLSGRLNESAVQKSLEILESSADAWSEARQLSSIIGERIPVFVSTWSYRPVAIRFKQELAENAKTLSFTEFLPDAGHNSIVAWGRDPRRESYKLISIIGGANGEEALHESFKEGCGMRVEEWRLRGEDLLSELLWGAWIAGLTSLIIAEKNGVDASETREIKTYREFLSKKQVMG